MLVTEAETKFTALDFKRIETDGSFEGYASLFNREDMGKDIVLPGAFRASLASRGVSGVRLLYQHDPREPIGVWSDIHENERGLFVRGHIAGDVVRGREVLALMRAGAIDGLSIGFRAVKAMRDARSGQRRLAEIDLWEISVVTFPMQPGARVSAVNGAASPMCGNPAGEARCGHASLRAQGRTLPTTREFERWLTRDAGLTRNEARTVIREGFKTLAARQEAGGGRTADEQLIEAMMRAAGQMSQAAMRN